MTDRVVDYGVRSLAYHIETEVVALTNAYVVNPDFDWDTQPDPSDPGNKRIALPLPFVGIVTVNDDTPPFSISDNILYEQNIVCAVHLCGSTYQEMKQLTADVKQALKTAVNPNSGSVGIVLYNFAVVSGSFYATAGTLQIAIQPTQYFGQPDEKAPESNRKYQSITVVELTAFKDATATLLENKGRIDLTDT